MEVLDNQDIRKKGTNKKHLLGLIPFSIAVILVFSHFIQVLSLPAYINENGATVSYGILSTVFYAGIGLAVTLVLILLKQHYWKFVFLGLIIVSFTSVIQFSNIVFFFGIGSLRFDIISLILLFFHVAMNLDMLKGINLKHETSEGTLKKRENRKAEEKENRVRSFERRFEKKRTEELAQIVKEKALIPEAIEAAERVLDKKEE